MSQQLLSFSRDLTGRVPVTSPAETQVRAAGPQIKETRSLVRNGRWWTRKAPHTVPWMARVQSRRAVPQRQARETDGRRAGDTWERSSGKALGQRWQQAGFGLWGERSFHCVLLDVCKAFQCRIKFCWPLASGVMDLDAGCWEGTFQGLGAWWSNCKI